jgi:hypothetical protein
MFNFDRFWKPIDSAESTEENPHSTTTTTTTESPQIAYPDPPKFCTRLNL